MNDTNPTAEFIEAVCQQVSAGKLAARMIQHWIESANVTDTEFRLLWAIRRAESGAPKSQTSLTHTLACSPAQVSGSCERLRQMGLAVAVAAPNDRRRQCWQLSEAGERFVASIVGRVESAARASQREAA